MTKVCMVFDAAGKYDVKSSNDATWLGPKPRTDLVEVLTHFCQAPVALSIDIS